MNPVGLILVCAGVFTISGAACDWDFFMENRRARLFVAIFGRNGARIFCGILDSVIVVMGALVTLGVVHDAS
jgi:Immunity protein 17